MQKIKLPTGHSKLYNLTFHGVVAERQHYQHTGYTLYRQDRTAASGKTRGGGLCLFVNNSWCTISKEVSSYCSPEVEYLMISWRPHNLPREFSSVLFVDVYIPPQTDAGTKTALNELHSTKSKQENVHPEAALLVAGDFNVGKLKSIFTNVRFWVKDDTSETWYIISNTIVSEE